MFCNISVKYHADIDKVEKIDKGDWVDLRAAEDYDLKANTYILINLGVSIKLPHGYEAHLAPRSSTFKNYGILQTNSIGVIDESYCGETDILMMPVWTTRDVIIKKNERICQFRIMEKMPHLQIKEVKKMEDASRGGFGETGRL